MSPKIGMLTFHDAMAIVEHKAIEQRPYFLSETVELPLLSSLGRILVRDIHSPDSVPSFDNSQMDGFLLESSEVKNAKPSEPLVLPIRGSLFAGSKSPQLIPAGAYEITTGARIPSGTYDCVMKVEDAKWQDSVQGRCLVVDKAIDAGSHVRSRGGDFQAGQLVARAGQVVSPELVMAFASLGIGQLPLARPVRVALLTTGNELQHHNDKNLLEGTIRDASGPYLQALLKDPRLDLILHKIIPDEPNLFINELRRSLELQADIVISTGAVSMGRHDFIRECLEDEGATILFHKVAMRPGKPILLAEWSHDPGSATFFGLPGNPISTLVGWRFFVDRYIRSLLGQALEKPGVARLMHPFAKAEGMSCVFKAFAEEADGERQVKILEGQGSHLISPLLQANCWVILPSSLSYLEAGEAVSVFPLHAHSIPL